MNSDKIVYWVALVVFAVGISHEYREGKFPAAHRVVTTAEADLCHLATRAEQTLALAKFIIAPPVAPASRDVFAVASDLGTEQFEMLRDEAQDQAQAQAELVREQVQAQAEMLRAQSELRRLQFDQMRHVTDSRFHFTHAADRHLTLVCPKTGAKIAVKVNAPDINVITGFKNTFLEGQDF